MRRRIPDRVPFDITHSFTAMCLDRFRQETGGDDPNAYFSDETRDNPHIRGGEGEPEEKAKPKGKMQYNFTDPESRIMPGADGFVQAYNAQIAADCGTEGDTSQQ
jgi:hypothetical protein